MTYPKALLVVSFGTSYEATRKNTIEAIENDLKTAFPDRTFFRAWTSGFIRRKIRERDGIVIPSIEEAMEEIAGMGVTDLLIQPTLMLAGGEYNKILSAVSTYAQRIETIRMGKPLLETETDIADMTDILFELFPEQNKNQMVAFMGHGSEDMRLPVYEWLNMAFEKAGKSRFCIGTVEFEPGIRPVLEKVRCLKPENVLLTPFLIVAGDHASRDMSGEGEDSWKNRIAAEGVRVECLVKGLGEYPQIRTFFVKKAKELL